MGSQKRNHKHVVNVMWRYCMKKPCFHCSNVRVYYSHKGETLYHSKTKDKKKNHHTIKEGGLQACFRTPGDVF